MSTKIDFAVRFRDISDRVKIKYFLNTFMQYYCHSNKIEAYYNPHLSTYTKHHHSHGSRCAFHFSCRICKSTLAYTLRHLYTTLITMMRAAIAQSETLAPHGLGRSGSILGRRWGWRKSRSTISCSKKNSAPYSLFITMHQHTQVEIYNIKIV